jgi:geranylgeranyl reductase family protein
MWDVLVVGGGPAGLVTARDLAGAGHAVCLLEEHATIGEPVHCTGLLGTDAFPELRLSRASIRRVTHAARFHAASGRSVLVDSDRIAAAIVDRAEFDAILGSEAQAAGAELRTGTRVIDIATSSDAVTVTVAAGDEGAAPLSLRARACVVACGANYRFNRRLGLGFPREFLQSAQLETPFAAVDDVQVYLGHDVAPHGFAWLVPFGRDGRSFARIGLMSRTKASTRFQTLVGRVARDHRYSGGFARPRLRLLPLGPISRSYAARVVAVGDAAGLVKPTTGGGIYYSLLSGQMAADVLDGALRADTLEKQDLAEYEARWRERLGPDIRAGLAFRALATRLNDRAIDAVVELASIDGLVPLLKQTADFNWHRGAVLSLLRHAGFRKILLTALWS